MTDHPLDQFDETDMTDEEFERAFNDAEQVTQRPRISGKFKAGKYEQAIRLGQSSESVSGLSQSQTKISFHNSNVNVEALSSSDKSALEISSR